MLQYTLKRMLERHQIVLERDAGTFDAFGGEGAPVWGEARTLKGLFWWWSVKGEGQFDEAFDSQRSVNVAGGGVLLPRGTDVTEKDRVSRILLDDATEIVGPFRVTSVREHQDHMEISLERP